ncbi:MAG TPA: CHASE2 domain-containing protein [Steroidobacteraceae bacterium]|nr:CHASE2 domain-containing protein [Steroidobacteraceae bacterium]
MSAAGRWRRQLLQQPFWFLAGLLCATALLYLSGALWRTDLALYDTALPTGPAPPDVVIVAIDDASIAQLGRWPWPRRVHAALLTRLRAAGVRAVALDILFTEADPDPGADAALAAALRHGPPTVLPLLPDLPGKGAPARAQLPIPELARAAAGLGHADLEVDRDGIVRSVYLREGPGLPAFDYLGAALLEHAPGGEPLHLAGERRPGTGAVPTAWVRDYRLLIPFLGPPGHFTQVSYADVLRGAVPPQLLAGKLVLVGSTALGNGDALPTPRSGESRPMPGVEICANVLQALRSGTVIRRAALPVSLALGLIPVALLAAGLQRLPPRRSLLLAASLWGLTLLASVLLLRLAHWWWPPAPPLAVLLLAYPLWIWRRLSAAQVFLDEELRQLAGERGLAAQLPGVVQRWGPDDFVQRRIELLRQANRRLRAAQQERTEVLRFLSHDMKSPAASLLGLAQLQRDPARALAPAELSQRLDLLAQRMLTLVDNFVALARAESADPDTFGQLDLRDAVQDAYDEVWAAARAREVTIAIAAPEDSCAVNGDRQLLARAIVNLLGNAVKFSPAGSPVELTCRRHGGYAVISVLDQGPGVDPEHRAGLFQRFSRGIHRGPDPGGAGLGLAFVRVVAQKHGGAAWADHERAAGTVFSLSVPLAGAPVHPDGATGP